MLIDKALQGEDGYPGGQDNITVELIKIDNSKHPKSQFKSYNPAPSKSNRKKGMSAGILAAIGAVLVALIVAGFFLWNSSMVLNYRIKKLEKEIKQAKDTINYFDAQLGMEYMKKHLDTQDEYRKNKATWENEKKRKENRLNELEKKRKKKEGKGILQDGNVKTKADNPEETDNTKAESPADADAGDDGGINKDNIDPQEAA